jgi:hypothetical protein
MLVEKSLPSLLSLEGETEKRVDRENNTGIETALETLYV